MTEPPACRGVSVQSARWSTLRKAFLSAVAASKGRTADVKSEEDEHKGERFEGFTLFPRREEKEEAEAVSGSDIVATYRLPNGSQVRTKEASSEGSRGGRVTLEQLFSHRVHGVDNTGNVRVWPAEQVLMHLLLSGPAASSLAGARVLELGAGKSGLAGLGVAVGSEAAEVVLTDGNPDAVKNIEACVELNANDGSFGKTKVTAKKLVWDRLDRDGGVAELLSSRPGGFDLVVASDCLFFKDFHDDLSSTIARLLAPGGRAILLQPQRGGTVDLFMRRVAVKPIPVAFEEAAISSSETLVERVGGNSADPASNDQINRDVIPHKVVGHGVGAHRHPTGVTTTRVGLVPSLLEARLLERYDERVWLMHREYLEKKRGGYVPDRHQPLLVEIRKLGTSLGCDGGVPATGNVEASDTIAAAAAARASWIPWLEEASPMIEEKSDVDGEGGSDGGVVAGGTVGGFQDETALLIDASPLSPPSPGPASCDHRAAALSARLDLPGQHRPDSIIKDRPDFPRDRPDRFQGRPDSRMASMYADLAARLLAKVRDRRNKVEGGGGSCDILAEQPRQLWVAVAGAPGSGKTTLAAEVCRLVGEVIPAVCLPMDGFHLYRRELDAMPDPEEAHRRRGAHWTFDGGRFLRDAGEARKTGRGSFPGFDHAVGDPVENALQVDSSHEVVIVEGNYLLLKGVEPWDEAGRLFDETWAIRCPPEVCGERVRKRHVGIGLSGEDARMRVETNDLPNARLVAELCPWDEVDVVIDSL